MKTINPHGLNKGLKMSRRLPSTKKDTQSRPESKQPNGCMYYQDEYIGLNGKACNKNNLLPKFRKSNQQET